MYALDFYSGYLEEVIATIGSRDVTLVERFLRLGSHTQMVLGLPNDMMVGWREAVEMMIMDPPTKVESPTHGVAMASLLRDAGQRRFRLFVEDPNDNVLNRILGHIGSEKWARDLTDSSVGGMRAYTDRLRWGFLDVNQVESLLQGLFDGDSFKTTKTAAIAGRLSHMARGDAERALLEVGVETQNSVSHNIDYLIIGSKGTGGTKHDKVKALQGKGNSITVLDEAGFDALISSPKPPPTQWSASDKDAFEQFVSVLRHVWAFELDLYAICYEYDPSTAQLDLEPAHI